MDYIKEANKVFAMARPHRFMDEPEHCGECRDVEEEAQNATPDSLTLEQVGHGYADLVIFLNDYGFLYFFPAFIRLCMDSNMEEDFIVHFIFAMTVNDESNTRLKACNPEQRKFVHNFLIWFKENNQETISHWLVNDDFDDAIQLWAE